MGMMAMNWMWFSALIKRAQDMVRRVQDGRAPTPDYERAPPKKQL